MISDKMAISFYLFDFILLLFFASFRLLIMSLEVFETK
jgi:hypothetical protein